CQPLVATLAEHIFKEKMKKITLLSISLLALCSYDLHAQNLNNVKQKIQELISGKNATFGIAISDANGDKTVYVNQNEHFPIQSVFKLPIAFYILSKVDEGVLSLNQKIKISKKELAKNTWSPI